MQKLLSFLLVMCSCLVAFEPSEVVVVYNADNEKSCEAMTRYCAGRRIPKKNRLPVYGVTRADITRAKYDANVKFPLLALGRSRGLIWPAGPQGEGTKIRAVVLMPELPLRVKEETPPGQKSAKGMQVNKAALDSELMLLGAEYKLSSMGSNPYYGKDELPPKGERQVVMSVCRIDGPDDECIERMIEDPLDVERTGLWGWTVVDTGGPYKQGDRRIEQVAEICMEERRPLFYETSKSTIVNDYPLMPDVISYFGWYTNPANGPFRKDSKTEFRFARGAIAFHLHSFSATSLYNGVSWVSALLKRGACVTAGNVAEPYLGPSLDCGKFFKHLYDGKCVGEAALLASPSVSWQCIILGDPLYRPFKRKTPKSEETNEFTRWYALVRRCNGDMAAMKSAVNSAGKRSYGAVFAEIYAGLCMATGQVEDAETYYRNAMNRYSPNRDKLRTGMLLAYTLKVAKKNDEAGELSATLRRKYESSVYAAAVKKLIKDIPPKAPKK